MDNFLGTFNSIGEVHIKYPMGGVQGEYVTIGDTNYYWNPFSLEWTTEKPTLTVPANKVKETNNLGSFKNILEVYNKYPDGGQEGDYLFIDGIEYIWNKWERQWQSKGDVTPVGGRTTNTFDGNLAVENDLYVGGILRVKGFAFDNGGGTPQPQPEQPTDNTITLKDLNEFPATPEQAIQFVKDNGKRSYFTLVDKNIAIGTVHIYADQFRQVLTEVLETRVLVNGVKVGGGHVYSQPVRYWRNYGLTKDYSGIKKHEWTLWKRCRDEYLTYLADHLSEMVEVYNGSPKGELRTLKEVLETITNKYSAEIYKKCSLVSFLDKTAKKRVLYHCTTDAPSEREEDWKRIITEDELEKARLSPTVFFFDGYAENVEVLMQSAVDDNDDPDVSWGDEPQPSPNNKKQILWEKTKETFICKKGDLYYNNWGGADDYGKLTDTGRKPRLGKLFAHREKGETFTWNGNRLLPLIGNSKTEIIDNATRISEEEIDKVVDE